MPSNIPGVYVERKYYTPMPDIDTRCLTGFVGVTEKGNVNVPTYLKSFEDYQKYFGGFSTSGRLPHSVMSFFKNGGLECYVVRVCNMEEAKHSRLDIPARGGVLMLRSKSVGDWGNKIKVSLWRENESHFSITFKYGSQTENFIHLSYNQDDERFFLRYIQEHSNLVYARVMGDMITSFNPMLNVSMTEGNDGLGNFRASDMIGHYTNPRDYSGLKSFEHFEDVVMIAAPDINLLGTVEDRYAVQTEMVLQAEKFNNRFAILDPPQEAESVDLIIQWRHFFDTAFAALYYPNISLNMPLSYGGGSINVPPSGFVCGLIASLDKSKGIFYPPAGMPIAGTNGISKDLSLGEQEMLYQADVNFFKVVSSNVKVWGCRTLSSDKEWNNINVRRTFSRICKFIKNETMWAVFEPNTRELRKKITRFLTNFLLRLFDRGYFAGNNPQEAFFVECTDEMNPPENIDRGILTFEIGIAIVRPVEFFKITFSADQSGSSMYFESNE